MQIGASISITTFCIGSLWNLFNTRESTMVMTLLGYYALIAVVILFVLKVTLPVEVFGVNANVRPRIAVPVGNTMVDLPMHGPLGAPYARFISRRPPEPRHLCTGQYAADDSRSGGAGILHFRWAGF